MKANTFIKILRRVIREEVQTVVREELGLLLETPSPKTVMTETKKPVIKNSMVESIKSAQSVKLTNFTKNNILNEMLNETAHSGEWKSIVDMKSSNVMGLGSPEPVVVSNVDQMLTSTRPAGDINAVQIDVVPDFTGLVSKMKEKGQL